MAAAPTARRAGLLGCEVCGKVSRPPQAHGVELRCPRCLAHLHDRKRNSLIRTSALLAAAVLCYLPANLLPIMTVVNLGAQQSDTILSGVIFLVAEGMWPLALIVFVASICIPILKIGVLALLLVSVAGRWRWRPVDRTRLYRLVDFIGRWSMVDVFVVAVLVALVRLGNIASVQAEPGVVFFAAVVVLTMFASLNFDPRLIWDAMEERHG